MTTDIPERERWLHENPSVLASVKLGLEQAASGDLHDLGSFAKYAWDGSPKIVDWGTDERIGSYPYEIEIGVRKGE